jgi:hypothetical protein
MKACPNCRTLNNDNSTFCKNCGSKIEEKVLFCVHCGSKTLSTNKFCKSCGKEIKSSASFEPDSKIKELTPVSVNKITPVNTQASSNQKKSKKKLVVTLSVIVSVFLLGLAITLVLVLPAAINPISKPFVNRFATDYSLSKDQRIAINRWGHPDGFLLVIDPKTSDRFESWFYYTIGSEMIFVNGKFMEGNDLTLYDLSGTKDEFTVYPYEFTNNIRRDDIIEVLGAPTAENNYQDGKLTTLYYKKQLIITLLDNKVAGITFFNAEPDKLRKK